MRDLLDLINTPTDYFVAGIVILVIVLLSKLIPDAKCPKCRKNQAMKKTGQRRKESDYVLSSTYIEWKCTHCGHLKWEERSASTGGGD